MRRSSLAEMLGGIGIVALGLAAIRDGSPLVSRIAFTLTLLLLLIALLGAWVGTRPIGAWRGFAVFGWAYFLVTFVPGLSEVGSQLPTAGLLDSIGAQFHSPPATPNSLAATPNLSFGPSNPYMAAMQLTMNNPNPDPALSAYVKSYGDYVSRVQNSKLLANLLLCWLFGFVGSIMGRALAARREPDARPMDRPTAVPSSEPRS